MEGVSAADFTLAIEKFKTIVGDKWVFTSDDHVDLYKDAYSPDWNLPKERVASAAVAPKTVEEIQAVVKVANEFSISLYSISTGKNLGYGGSAPAHSGDVVLDLKRMNKIIEVNEKNAFALVEPGVSYFDLYNYIQEKGLKLWIDVPDPGWGSLIGNSLDRGSGYTLPHLRNHFEAHCGMEIVLANGEVVRTGMGALPGAETWQQHKTGYGPYIDGIFSQSNFGIVTKMGFWLMPEPDAFLRCDVLFPRYNDLHQMVDTLNFLENTQVFNGTPDFGSPLLGVAQLEALTNLWENGMPPIEEEHKRLVENAEIGYSKELEEYGIKNNIPYWKCSFTFYGPAQANLANWEYVKEQYRKHVPDVYFKENDLIKLPLTEEQKKTVNLPEFGIPALQNFAFGSRTKQNPNNPMRGHIGFSPIIPRTGDAIIAANKVFAKAAKKLNIPSTYGGSFMLPVCYWERTFVIMFGLPVTYDVETNQKFSEAFEYLMEIGAENGWAEYRSSPIFQDRVAKTFSYNDHSLWKLHQTLKDAMDPNGILSPGRYGVWPKRFRNSERGV